MWEGELDLGDKELFDVRTADIVCLLDLNHSENLRKSGQRRAPREQFKKCVRGSSGSELGVWQPCPGTSS